MVFNPHKKMTVTWKEFCGMKEKEHDEVLKEIEKEKKEENNETGRS